MQHDIPIYCLVPLAFFVAKPCRVIKQRIWQYVVTLKVEIEVSTGLQKVILARVRMSIIYLCWHNIRPIAVG
jgi:hypothetical protein